MIFVSKTGGGERISYSDGKRYLWLLSVISPSMPLLSVLLLAKTGQPLFALLPILIYFGLVPLLDWWIGEDINNPPEEIIEQLSGDQFYRTLLFASVPVFYAGFIAGMIVAGTVAYGASEADKKMHYVETDAVLKSARIECYVEHGKKYLAEKSTDKMAYMDCDLAPIAAESFGYEKSDIHHRNTMTYSFKSPVDGKTYTDNYNTKSEPLASLTTGKHFKMYAHKTEAGKSRIN